MYCEMERGVGVGVNMVLKTKIRLREDDGVPLSVTYPKSENVNDVLVLQDSAPTQCTVPVLNSLVLQSETGWQNMKLIPKNLEI